jgi:hypothetical protein
MIASSEPEKLPTYFAVQMKASEKPHDLVTLLMRAAKNQGKIFRKLEVLDTLTVGTTAYLRMRSDLQGPETLLEEALPGRANITSSTGVYLLQNGTRKAKIPNVLMLATPKLGQMQAYHGTKIKHWERQFST